MKIEVNDLVDLGYVCGIADCTDYPLSYKFNDDDAIDAFSELLWENEECSGNEFEIDAEQFFELVDPYLKQNWHIIKSHINFE